VLSALILAAVILVFCAVWILIGRPGRSSDRSAPQLKKVDIIAFRNLASREEDVFLRTSLRPSDYRAVRRSRLRAMQEYLLWIAANCSAIIALLRGESAARESDVSVPQAARMAAKIRILCLGYWCLLWAEYLLPNLNVQPVQLVRKYEDLWLLSQTTLLAQTPVAISLR